MAPVALVTPRAPGTVWARWRRWQELVPAVPLLVVCLGGTRAAGENQQQLPGASAYALAALAALTLLLRRRAPGSA